MRRPLGCMTFSALVAAIAVVLVIIGAALATGNGIFSPGALNSSIHGAQLAGATSHADLQGRCDACHATAWSSTTMGDLCLSCHKPVGDEIAAQTGLHGRLKATSATCRNCHTEHGGANAALTLADPRDFPHDQTGFALASHQLKGKGGEFTCSQCHPGSPQDFTKPACASCHQKLDSAYMAKHTEAFGSACLTCHDGKESYGKSFAHATYPLEGGHAKAECSGCHKAATTLAVLRETPTACVSCHAAKDIHEGRLGKDCSECHTPKTWTDAKIDHNRTRFVLVGKHASALCESCHTDRHWTGIATTCAACHAKDDPHKGQFKADCATCHAATGWKDVTFDHSKTRFALKDAHAKPACSACHADGTYVGTPTTCAACHTKDDAHKGQFGSDCAKCHTATKWTDATFDHNNTAFKLTGAHDGVTCQKCHTGGKFAGTPTTCSACHTRPATHGSATSGACNNCHTTKAWKPASFDHDRASFRLTGMHLSTSCGKCHTGGKLAGTPSTCSACHNRPADHGADRSAGCGSCHSTKAWKPASFDHATTGFKLTGAHAHTSCTKCHVGGVFKGTPTTCASCHNRPSDHGADRSGGCAACHTTAAWTPASFDHSGTSFPLTGAHLKVSCAKCHVNNVFNGTPHSCAACHSSPPSHGTAYNSGCAACHTTKAWKPGSFTGTHTFPMTHRGAGGVCSTCHPTVWAKYTCSKCHSDAAMNNRHSQVSGFSLTTCAKCHPRGGGG